MQQGGVYVERLIRFSMKNGIVIVILMMMVVGFGVQSVRNMEMEQYPNVDIPYLTVVIPYPGASPEQAMKEIGEPLEKGLSQIAGVEKLYASGWANGFSATLQFAMDTNMTEAKRQVQDAVTKANLPEGILEPRYAMAQPDNPEIYSLGVFSDHEEVAQSFVQDRLLPELQEIKGIEEVRVTGNETKKIYVKVKTEALKAYHLTIDQVKQALIANNLSVPTGEITLSEQVLPIRVNQKIGSLEQLKKMNLLVVEQDFSSMTEAFTQINDGMRALGSGIQSVGRGLSSLGELQNKQAAQVQILAALQGLSGNLIQDQMKLSSLLANKAQQGGATDQEIASLQEKIKGEEIQIRQLQAEFSSLTEEMKKMAGASPAASQTGQNRLAEGAVNNQGVQLNVKAIPLEKIATVSYESDPASTIARVNGKPAVTIGILPETGQNVVTIVKEINARLQSLTLPQGVRIEVLRDQSKQIEGSVMAMLREALLGALMAVVVTLLFLRNLRSTLIAILSIPLSVFASFILLEKLGYSLNIITLSGIAVAVGRVIDDSIVVIENIFRRLRRTTVRSGELVEESTLEVAKAIASSTVTTVAVFLPLAFIPGIVGKFFTPLAWTIVISLIFSLLVAVTIVPLLSRLFLMKMKAEEPKENRLQRGYKRLLRWALKHRFATLGAALILLLLSTSLSIPNLGFNFLPQEEVHYYDVTVKMAVGTAREKTDRVSRQVESILLSEPGIEKVTTFIDNEKATLSFAVKEEGRKGKFDTESLRDKFSRVTGAEEILLSGIGAVGGGQTNDFILVINGPSMEAMKKAAELMVGELKNIPGLADIHATNEGLKPEILLQLNEKAMADKGLYPGMVGLSLRNMLSGDTVTNITLNGKPTDVVLKQELPDLHSLEDLSNQKVSNMIGDEIPLKEIGQLTVTKQPVQITRLNQKEYIMLRGTITDPNASKVIGEAENALKNLSLPEGVSWYKEGASEAMTEGFRNMGYALILSVLFIYIAMVIAFGEAKAPFVILFAIPFSAIGALIGLLLVREPIGMPALIGLLMLNGIVVTNAIVLIDRVKQNERKGFSTEEALLEAGTTRLRPILMTAIATIGALFPMALSTDAGIISRSLAAVVIGGLTTSTLLTLLIVPVLYSLLHSSMTLQTSMKQGM